MDGAAIYSLFIINKSGGLIFYKDYGSAGRMDTNDSLRLASLWHSMHAISQQLSPTVGVQGSSFSKPTPSISIAFSLLQHTKTEGMYAINRRLPSLDLSKSILAGTKFFVVCEPGTQRMEALLKFIYELFADYVLKNPFYEMEMPIRCELFDLNLLQAVQKDRVALLSR
ncbi:hypothetical protein Syun_029029 [Stephania yunnanensis]|uniref:Trafficking protein particle complex subunit n=1 Tax=Stephania yunnanensis TaxID=152371 RepID=A0AAP0E4M5_9MAGN